MRRGRGQWGVFDQSLHRRVTNRLARENQLRHAIGRSLHSVHIQPIVDLETGHVKYGQGFLFSPAVSAEESRELLAGWSARRADYVSPPVPRG